MDSHYTVPPGLVQIITKVKELKGNRLLCATTVFAESDERNLCGFIVGHKVHRELLSLSQQTVG